MAALLAAAAVVAGACSGNGGTGGDGGGVGDGGPAGATAASTAPARPGELRWGDCPWAVDGVDLRCGELTVPSDDGEAASVLRLPVVVLPATGPDPAADPVVVLTGGPGQSAITYLAELAAADEVRARRDVVVVEQRGNPAAHPPLTCPEAAGVADVAGVLACRDRLAADGVDLADYTTAAAADDVDRLRVALRVPTVNLWAVSYGTRVALDVLRRHPTGVRAVVLDSTYPPTVDNAVDQPAAALDQLGALLDACAADPNCATAHRDPAAELAALVQSLNVTPADIAGRAVDGVAFLQAVVTGMSDTAVLPHVPAAIAQAAAGDIAGALGRLAPPARPLPQGPVDPTPALGAQLAVLCQDEAPFDSPPGTPVATDRPWAVPVVTAARNLAQEVAAACRALAVAPSAPDQAEPVAAATPALLLSGLFDPLTPPAFGDEAAATLDRASVVTVPGAAHHVTAHPCPRAVTAAFLDDPSSPPDTSCIDALALPPFERATP